MTTKRPQNSILVLATLGVYLGLVLAGATPQILAQAATTRQFDVKDEIEYKEDLDKKPDNIDGSYEDLQSYISSIEEYFVEVRAADERLGSKYGRTPEFVLLGKCYTIGNADRPFGVAETGFIRLPILLDPQYSEGNWDWNLSCEPPLQSDGKQFNFAQVTLSGTQKGVFKYQISLRLPTSSETVSLFDNLERAFKRLKAEDLSSRKKVLFENTTAVISEDKITIVTRLPRAGLDALLAKDAK